MNQNLGPRTTRMTMVWNDSPHCTWFVSVASLVDPQFVPESPANSQFNFQFFPRTIEQTDISEEHFISVSLNGLDTAIPNRRRTMCHCASRIGEVLSQKRLNLEIAALVFIIQKSFLNGMTTHLVIVFGSARPPIGRVLYVAPLNEYHPVTFHYDQIK